MISILVIVFLLLFFLIHKLNNYNFTSTYIISFVSFSAFIAITTEILSLLNYLTVPGVTTLWFTFGFILFLVNKKFKIQYVNTFRNIGNKIIYDLKKQTRIELMLLLLITILYIAIFIQGIIYPSNNWDSLSYHMPRTIEWLSHGNLQNFQTHIIRQLYQPSLCEYFILHFNAVSKNDYFSNSVQFFFLLGTIGTTIGVLKLIFGKINYVIALIIIATIPHALLEASSTQNDIIHSYFIVATIYFGFKLIKEINRKDLIFFGLTIGLALLSKAIAYIYLPVIVSTITFLIVSKIIKSKSYKILTTGLLSILLILVINFPHSFRNYTLTNDIMGTDKKEKADYLNEKFNTKFILSTVIKNIGLHFDSFYVGNLGNQIVEKSHIIINQDINEKGSNVFDMKYNCNHDWKNHEDTQPNFIHFILFSSSLLIIFFKICKRKSLNKYLILLNSLVILSFVFFCAMLTWEPWNTRLHLPLFFLMCPSIYMIIKDLKSKYLIIFILTQFTLYGYYTTTFNYSKPFLSNSETSKIKLNDNRFKKYFANQIHLYNDYVNLQKELKNNKNCGLIITNDTWEYPIHFNFINKKTAPVHINVSNYTNKIESKKNIEIDCIISNVYNKEFIFYKGENYKNTTLNNKYIWFYKKYR